MQRPTPTLLSQVVGATTQTVVEQVLVLTCSASHRGQCQRDVAHSLHRSTPGPEVVPRLTHDKDASAIWIFPSTCSYVHAYLKLTLTEGRKGTLVLVLLAILVKMDVPRCLLRHVIDVAAAQQLEMMHH